MKQVVLIVFDSVRLDHVGYNGYERDTTPNIDGMASKFNALVPAPILPITNSSAYAMLTGQTKQVLSGNKCPQNIKMLQRFMPRSMIGANHTLLFSALKWNLGWKYHYLMEAHPPFIRPCREIIRWFLESLRKESPCFTMLWFLETHAPYTADKSFDCFYNDDVPTIEGEVVYYDLTFPEPDFRRHMAQYDSSIHNLDDAIAPILAEANDDTLIIVCSDHGDYLGEHGFWFTHAGRPGPDILRPVFMSMSQPSPRDGGDVTILDIAPTVAEWLNIQKQDCWEGHSLL
jgi:arylsulfatase A-like enzyme